ncbi:ribosome maturation factor RimM [Lachnospiraceae bacterium 29-84]
MEDWFQIGIVTNTHGLHGEVKVFPTTDDAKRFKKLEEVFLETKAGKIPLKVAQARFSKQMVILKFQGKDRIEDVQGFRGNGLFVTREHAVECKEGEYYIADLIGMEAVDEDGLLLGRVADVIQTGANDVYVVQVLETSPYVSRVPGKNKELLLPAIKECILDVDVPVGRITVHLMEGLLEPEG